MSQKAERVYIRHMIDNSNKAMSFVKDINREDFDRDEQLRLALTHLLQTIAFIEKFADLRNRDRSILI